MHSNVTIKNISWPHFSWTTLYNKQTSRSRGRSALGTHLHDLSTTASIMDLADVPLQQ